MGTSTTVVVLDPGDPYDLFHCARKIAGSAPRWHQHDDGAVRWLQAESGQGSDALVSLHWKPGAARRWHDDDGGPAGFAQILLTTSGGDHPAVHERLAGLLLGELAARGLRAAWRYRDDPWRQT